MVTLCLEDVKQILEASSEYNPHELPQIKQKIKTASNRYLGSMNASLHKGRDNLDNQLDRIGDDNPELKAVIDSSRIDAGDAANDIADKIKRKIKSKVKKAPKRGKVKLKESFDPLSLDLSFLEGQSIYDLVEAELEEGFIDIMPNMYKALRDARKNKDGQALKVLDYVKIILISVIGILSLIIINTFLSAVFSSIFGPVIGMALGAIISAPIFEELYKVVSLKIMGNNIPAAVFAYTEFLLYMSRILKTAATAASPVGMFLNVSLGLIIRIWAADSHMVTSRLYKADYDQFGKVRWRTYLKGVGLHAIWNTLASLGEVLSLIGKGIATLFNFVGLGGLVILTKKSSAKADQRELKQALKIESRELREYILFS